MVASTSSKFGQTPLGFRKALEARHKEAEIRPPSSSTEDAGLQVMEVETDSSTRFHRTPTFGKTTGTSYSSAQKSPGIFEHHKLTPHELKTLIELEESIPLKYIAADASGDATSWSQIFVAARRLIVDGAMSREEYRNTGDDEDGAEDLDDRLEKLDDGRKRCEEEEVVLTKRQGKRERRPASGLITPQKSGSRHLSEDSARSTLSCKTVASSIAASEEALIAISERRMVYRGSMADTGEDIDDKEFCKWPRASALRRRIAVFRAERISTR